MYMRCAEKVNPSRLQYLQGCCEMHLNVIRVEMLNYLASVSKGPVQRVEVLLQCCTALFDMNPSQSTHLPVHLWKQVAKVLLEVLDLLMQHR